MVEPLLRTDLFIDPAISRVFDEQGFAAVPLLDPNAVRELHQLWETLQDDTKALSLSTTIFSKDPQYRRAVSEGVRAVVEPRLRHLMCDVRMIFGSFVVKQAADADSPMPIHQDSSYVDESAFAAATVWIPTCDTDEENGALWVVPGSHRWNRFPRAFGSSLPYADREQDLREMGIPLYVRAGTALIFSQAMIHFSPPNRSSQMRVAGGGVVTHADAPARFLWNRDDGRIDVYEVEDDFFLSFDPAHAPVDRRPRLTIDAQCEPFDPRRPRLVPE